MKQNTKLKTYAIGGLTLILILGLTDISSAQGRRGGQRGFLRQRFLQTQLTEEQREEIKTLIQDMRDQDADRKAIHDAVQEKLNEWGIEKPERPLRLGRFGEQLTEAQREEIKNLIQSMHDQDADRKAIYEAVQEKLNEWGIEKPERPLRLGRFGNQLTEAQREEIKNLIQSMRNQDADRKAIHEAVKEKLNEWGIESPRRGQRLQDMGKKQERGKSFIRANNRPNPFNPETIINYTLENPEHVTIKIYNIQGQLIRTLTDTQKSSGTHHVRWDGHHDNGEAAPAGMYIYRIEAGKQILSGRMTLAK